MNSSNSKIIMLVAVTICISAIIGVGAEAFCVIYKIPDMSNAFSGGFVHVVDTLIGALIAMLINTRAQPANSPESPASVVVENKPNDPVPTTIEK